MSSAFLRRAMMGGVPRVSPRGRRLGASVITPAPAAMSLRVWLAWETATPPRRITGRVRLGS